jgi:hypothetical protein
MSNTENQKAREEMAIDALIAAVFKDDSIEADDKDIERYGNVLSDDDRKKLDEAGKGLIDSLFAGAPTKPKEQATQSFSTAMNRGDEGLALTDRASEEKERRIEEARARRKRNKKLQEHDMVRVRGDVEVEGYSLRAGMVGTVVSVYRNGEAFAVEFPELERGSAVVTLYRDQVEPAEETDE